VDEEGAGAPVDRDRPARVLVVEDDEDLARVVQLNLEGCGYEVELAHNGVEALESVRGTSPDLILLDVMMPVMDGWQTLQALKADEETAHLPVVMLTALAEERDVIQGHLEGAIRYVTKPFEMRELLASVEEALRPVDEEERERRRAKVMSLLRRLAEMDAGRTAERTVRISGLESLPRAPRRSTTSEADLRRAEDLTAKQRELASAFAAGRSARELADELGVSRSNVYATRKRIARKLGVSPEDVAEEARRLGL
jgi:DNA-binding response OmpR family regulator